MCYIEASTDESMLTKAKLKEQLEKLPEQFSIDQLIDRLIVIEKIEKGMEQSQKRKVISDDKLDREIEKWFK